MEAQGIIAVFFMIFIGTTIVVIATVFNKIKQKTPSTLNTLKKGDAQKSSSRVATAREEKPSKSEETVKTTPRSAVKSEQTVKSDNFATEIVKTGNGCLSQGTLLQAGRYRVDKYLASGGFGNTYVVEHTRLGTKWAMKEFYMRGINTREGTTVTVGISDNEDIFQQMKEKFLKEARRLSSLKNEHIIELIDFFEENETAYYVMKYIEGKSLSSLMKEKNAPLSESQVRTLLPQVLDALRCMHEHQLYHLDLKPGNIMQDYNGHICLIDFGSSKQLSGTGNQGITTTTGLSYTPGFAPSEQVSGNTKRIGPWTDFYSLGATIYNLLTFQTPPEENDIMYDGERAFNFDGISPEMKNLILLLMNPRYDQRPQRVDEIDTYLK